jgi:site-specific DNA recombinase
VPEETRRCAVYARISRDKVGAGLGVDRQRSDCLELAERLGWAVVAVHTDNDVSAYSGRKRPGYEALLSDMQAGRISGVVSWHTDRLHRSPRELERYIDISEATGTITHTVRSGELDLATPTGRMTARITGAVARHESEHKGARVTAARLQNVRAGRWGGGPRPFGYEGDGLTPRPGEAKELATAIESIAAGASVRSVVNSLNARGVTSSTGRTWQTKTLRDVLKRPRNAGLAVYRGEIVGKASFPGVVPEETWRAVAGILTDPSRRTNPGSDIRWLGSHLYVCGVCGSRRVISSTSGSRRSTGEKRPASYRCRANDAVSANHFVRRADSVDRLVIRTVVERLSRADAVDLLAIPEGPDTSELRIEGVTIAERLVDLADAFAEGEVNRAQLVSATEKLRTRQAEIEDKMSRAAMKSPLAAVVGAQDIQAVWDGLDLSRQRAIVDALMVVTIMPTKRGPIFDPASVDISWKT